jgi:uncharacterized protein (TIGR03790 family)
MKQFIIVLFIVLLCQNLTEAQTPTYAGLPRPENVLVVFNANSDTSRMVKDYYKLKRGIPAINIIQPGLDLPDLTQITVDGVTHAVGLAQETDIIRDFHQDSIHTATATFHAWQYFITYVRNPIYNYIQNHNLRNTIRYIVLCKGVPCKIQAAGNDDYQGNVSLDGLLCILNTDGNNYESFLHYLFPLGLNNPYHNADADLTMDYRFLPDHFTTLQGSDTVKLSYLVSHLDGIDLQNVYNIIDRSVNADTTGDGWWIIDDDPNVVEPGYIRRN